MKDCTFIGQFAGADLKDTDADGIVIIGHNVRSLDKSQENTVFIGDKVAISRDVWEAIANVLGDGYKDLIKNPENYK